MSPVAFRTLTTWLSVLTAVSSMWWSSTLSKCGSCLLVGPDTDSKPISQPIPYSHYSANFSLSASLTLLTVDCTTISYFLTSHVSLGGSWLGSYLCIILLSLLLQVLLKVPQLLLTNFQRLVLHLPVWTSLAFRKVNIQD